MGILKQLGIVKSDKECVKIFESLFDCPFHEHESMDPHEYVKMYWNKYKEMYPNKGASVNGKVFELIIHTLFVRENLVPLYIQAKVAFVPNVNFDTLLYSEQNIPYAFSLKTSLRERYKQADLEGIALKYVHRRAKCYLLTLDETEAKNVKEKIKNGGVIGLDKAILCTNEEFDSLIRDLKSENFIEAGSVEIISTSFIVTQNKINTALNRQ